MPTDNPHTTICPDCDQAQIDCDCEYMGKRAAKEYTRLREERDALAESVAGLQAENARLIREFNTLNFQAARIRREAKLEEINQLRQVLVNDGARKGGEAYVDLLYCLVEKRIAALEADDAGNL